MKLKNYPKAIVSLENALKEFNSLEGAQMRSGSFKALYNLGICYRNVNNLDDSVKRFENAIQIPGGAKAAAYNNLGLSNFQRHHYKQSIAEFSKAIEMSDGQVAVHYNNRGLALYHIDKDQVALEDFSKAIALNANDPNVLFNRGNVYLHLSKFDEAREDFD